LQQTLVKQTIYSSYKTSNPHIGRGLTGAKALVPITL